MKLKLEFTCFGEFKMLTDGQPSRDSMWGTRRVEMKPFLFPLLLPF